LRGDSLYRAFLNNELDIQMGLYEVINVPRPIGIFDLDCFEKKYPAIVMEKVLDPVQDCELEEYGANMPEEDKRSFVDKAREVGFFPGKDWNSGRNILWSRTDMKFYIIDFGSWYKKYWKD